MYPRGEGSSCRAGWDSSSSWNILSQPPAQWRLDHRICKEMPRKLGLISLKRKLKEKIVAVICDLMGGKKENRAGIF